MRNTKITNERRLDFESIDGHVLQEAETRVAGAKIIKVDFHAKCPNRRDQRLGPTRSRQGGAFGNLQPQACPGQPALVQNGPQLIQEVGARELSTRDVHAHLRLGAPGSKR